MNVRPIPAAELDGMWPWAEKWLARFSWVALLVGGLLALTVTIVLKERTAKAIEQLETEHDWDTLRHS